jgi:uncharacterized damage-inducible protein DinB
MKPLSKAVQHCVWANGCWIDFVASTNASDHYVVTRISHILLGEQAWFQRIAGEPLDHDIWRAMTVDQLRAMHRRHEEIYNALLQSDLDRIIGYQRFTGEKYQSSISDIVLHLATHGAHHRGQLAAHIGARGERPPKTDFVQFCIVKGL